MRESSYSTLTTTTASTVKGLTIASGSSSSGSDNGANYNNLNSKEDYYIRHNRTPPNRAYQFSKYNSNCIKISNNAGQMRLPLRDSSVLNSNSHHYSSFTSTTTTTLFRTLLQNPTLIFILAICLLVDRHSSIIPSVLAVPPFRYDCSNNLHKEIACSVHIVDCKEELVEWISNDSLQLLPSSVHDIRVEPFARAMPRRSQQKYQLSVDISWQMPPDNSTSLLKAFLLEINPADGTSSDSSDNRHPSCFLFNVTQSDWTTELITSSPRFHFSTESIFEFGGAYNVILTSLPRSQTQENSVTKYVVMPRHPELSTTLTDATFDCSKYSNPQASRWTAGFRRIFVHSLARTIQIEFVGAPAHYCFEAYEVRLKDETGLDLLYSSIIPVQAMRSETIDNNTVLFGECNFTDLELERDYVPSVIPIERADDGRCLCPVSGNDPFDNRVVCSCIAADWKKVRLHRLERPTAPPMVTQLNGTIIEATPHSDSDTFWTIVVLSILIMAFLLLLLIIYALHMFYHRYSAHTKTVQIRFISNNLRSSNALLTHPSSSISRTSLIHNLNPNVLLIYTHDCCAHEAAVLALAEYLRDIFSFDVHLDVWESDEIERNFMDYISSSILNADKVMIVNSMGAYLRYQNKVEHRSRVERKQHTLYDNLYESQIDQALMHPCVVSVRFTYTPYSMVLPPLGFSLQYVLPDNIAPLLSNLTDSNMKYDSRLFTYNAAQVKLNSAISRMRTLIISDPNWFQQTHHRVPLLIKSSVQPVEPLTDIPALSNGDVHSKVYPEQSLRTVGAVVSGVVPHQAMPTATTVAENLSDDSGVVNSTSVALEYDDQQQLLSSQSLSQEQSVESLPSRKQSTSAAVIALSNPLTNPPSTDIEDEGCQSIEMTSSNICNGDDRDQDGYDIQTPATTTNYPLLNGGIKIDTRFALKTPLLLNGADEDKKKKKNANKIGELRDNQQANNNTKQQQQQNGHINNGVMGRLMKGFISQQQQPQQHDSGLIVDMDSVDIPSS